jgi:hypothetical protein
MPKKSKKNDLPTIEEIEQAELVLDQIESVWRWFGKKGRYYVGANGGLAWMQPKQHAEYIAENPSAKPLELPPLDRRMLTNVKMLLQHAYDRRDGKDDEVEDFVRNMCLTENPSDERRHKMMNMIVSGELAAYDRGDGICVVQDKDVEDFERDHPEAKRIASAEDAAEFIERMERKLRLHKEIA